MVTVEKKNEQTFIAFMNASNSVTKLLDNKYEIRESNWY
jgi:hypothetical protein